MSSTQDHHPVILDYADGRYDASARFESGWYHLAIYSKYLNSGEPSNMPSFGSLSDKIDISRANFEALAEGKPTEVVIGGVDYPCRPKSLAKGDEGMVQGNLFGAESG